MVENQLAIDAVVEVHGYKYKTIMPEATTKNSGFIVSPNGLIVTKYISLKTNQAIVIFFKKVKYKTKVIHADKFNEFSILKIIPTTTKIKFPWLKIGSRDSVEVGDYVTILEYSLNEGSRKSGGIITKLIQIKNIDFFMSDAIPKYNRAGSPIVNVRGEVVGIVLAFLKEKSGYLQTISPLISNIKDVVDKLEKLVKQHE